MPRDHASSMPKEAAVRPTSTVNEAAEPMMPMRDGENRYQAATEKVTISMWPANMFANRRTECVNGRTMKFDRISIGMSRTYIAFGTSRGIEGFRRHHQAPFLAALPDRRGGYIGVGSLATRQLRKKKTFDAHIGPGLVSWVG